MVGELEIASLGSDFGTNQDAGALGFREPGCIAVTLKKGEFLMEKCGLDLNAGEEKGANRLGHLHGMANEDDLVTGKIAKELRQPVHACFKAITVLIRVGFKGELTLTENLDFESGLRTFEVSRRESVLERLSLTRIRNLTFRSLSAGQQRRVAVARMMLSTARLWLMDEPFTNLDREGQLLVHDLISGHLEAGGLCMVATHQPIDIRANTLRLAL